MKKIINLFIGFFLLTGLSSCLKDDTIIGPDSPGAVKNVMEFANVDFIKSQNYGYPLYVKSYNYIPSATLPITVRYAGVDAAPEDIAVKVILDPTMLTKYNNNLVKAARDGAIAKGEDPNAAEASVQDQKLYILPSATFTLPSSLDLVIKKGAKEASFTVALKPNLFDFDHSYALPFKIESSTKGPISGNFGSILVSVIPRNKLDGIYNYKSGPTQSLRPNTDEDGAELITSGATTVTIPLVNYYTAASNLLTYKLDPVTNAITVLNGGIGTPITDPTSNYNPTTKVIRVKWTAGTRSFDETFTWKALRD